MGFDVVLVVLLAVVVCDLIIGFDLLDREQKHAVPGSPNLAIWSTAVVGIARRVLARRAFDRIPVFDLKQVSTADFLSRLVAHELPPVLDHKTSLWNFFPSKKSEPGRASVDAQMKLWWS